MPPPTGAFLFASGFELGVSQPTGEWLRLTGPNVITADERARYTGNFGTYWVAGGAVATNYEGVIRVWPFPPTQSGGTVQAPETGLDLRMSFMVRFDSTPATIPEAGQRIVSYDQISGNAHLNIRSDRTLRIGTAATAPTSQPLELGRWYLVEWRMNLDNYAGTGVPSTITQELRIDGRSQGTITESVTFAVEQLRINLGTAQAGSTQRALFALDDFAIMQGDWPGRCRYSAIVVPRANPTLASRNNWVGVPDNVNKYANLDEGLQPTNPDDGDTSYVRNTGVIGQNISGQAAQMFRIDLVAPIDAPNFALKCVVGWMGIRRVVAVASGNHVWRIISNVTGGVYGGNIPANAADAGYLYHFPVLAARIPGTAALPWTVARTYEFDALVAAATSSPDDRLRCTAAYLAFIWDAEEEQRGVAEFSPVSRGARALSWASIREGGIPPKW